MLHLYLLYVVLLFQIGVVSICPNYNDILRNVEQNIEIIQLPFYSNNTPKFTI